MLSGTLGGAGTGHGIDIERLFNYFGGVGGIVQGYPVFYAADAVIGRDGLDDDVFDGREVGGEGACEIIRTSGGRTIFY